MDALVGRTLGEFVVGPRLGQGGFGTVYRAEQRLLRRTAVVKVLNLAHRGEEVVIQRFLREAQLASQLDHPYCAHIYSFGAEPDGLMWLAMEMVRGSALDRVLDTQGPMPLERFVPLLQRLCEVVHAAHERGIVHRDIKPANVMVCSRSGMLLPKLLDFGIAKSLVDDTRSDGPPAQTPPDLTADGADADSSLDATIDRRLTRAGAVVGSPYYMAPEQWLNKDIGPATDVYALTVLSYELISGRLPFTGRSERQVARAHATLEVPPLGGGLPAALDEVMRRGLAKRAADRFGSALELADAFRSASGITAEQVVLDTLDESVRDTFVAEAPQGLAEAVARLDTVRSVHQAKEALLAVMRVAIHHVGLYALAVRTSLGAAKGGDAPGLRDLLRALRRDGLQDRDWVALARELMRPHAAHPDVAPLPELVALFFDEQAGERDPFGAILAVAEHAAGDDATEAAGKHFLTQVVPRLNALLRQLAFLCSYPLVVARGGGVAERWSGVRRPARVPVEVSRPLEAGAVVLVDADATPILRLSPMFGTAAPAPGDPPELFLFDGPARGARFIAPPIGYQRRDDAFWEWFRVELLSDREGSTEESDARSPYLGLSAFTADDVGFFVGREREVDAFLNRMTHHAFLAVVGPSGAGKSSFIQAGVIPGLSTLPMVVTTRPGPSPIAALQGHLEHAGIDASGLREALEHDRGALGRIARAFSSGRGQPLVLVVDQFEELFTLGASEHERRIYAEALCQAVRTPDDPLRVLVTLRDDFLARAQEIGDLRERLREGLSLLVTPSVEDLERILIEPARRVGYVFEDAELPREMVASIAGQRGALPLLSFAAARLWEVRDRHFKHLPRRAFEALGGVGGALAAHAEGMLSSLQKEEQRLVRQAFRHLVTAEGTRATLRRKELVELLGSGVHAESTLERLIASRLVVVSDDEGGDRVEIAHEALIVAWPRLAEWRRDDAEGVRLRDQLRAATRQWEERSRPRGLLWRDEALAELTLWRARTTMALTQSEEEFARRSKALAARGVMLGRGLLAAVFVVFAAVLATVLVLNHRNELARRAAIDQLALNIEEQGRGLVLQGDPMKALVYLDEARRMGSHGAGLQHLLARALAPFEGERLALEGLKGCAGVRLSADGERLLGLGLDGRSVVWRLRDGARLAALEGHTELALAGYWISADRIWTASFDGTARLWDATTGSNLATVRSSGGEMMGLAASADGRRVATYGRDGVVRILDARDGTVERSFAPVGEPVAAGSFSPDGGALAVGGWDHLVRVLDTSARGSPPIELRGHTQAINAVCYAPDGKRVASASRDGTARIFEISTRRALVLDHNGDEVRSLEYSPDGQRLLTVAGGRAFVFDAHTGRLTVSLQTPRGALTVAAFSPDGERIATGGADGIVRLWDAHAGRPLSEFVSHLSPLQQVRFTPGGDEIVSASVDGSVRVWSAAVARLASGAHADSAIVTGAISSDGTRLFALSLRGEVTRYRARDLTPEARFSVEGLGATPVASFARDGTLLATAEGRGVRTWDLDGKPKDRFGAEREVSALAVFAAGHRAVVGGQDGAIEWWELDPPRRVATTPLGGDGAVLWLRYDASGGRLLAGRNRVVTVLDARSHAQLAVLDQHEGMVNAGEFSRDGSLIATASDDRKARVWRLSTGARLIAVDADGLAISVTFDERGELLLVGTDSGEIGWWEIASGRQIAAVPAHKGFISFLDWRGDRVYSGAADGGLATWPAFADKPDAALLAQVLRCRVGYALKHGLLEPKVPEQCAQLGHTQ